MTNKERYIPAAMTLVFAVVVWCFWSLKYPYALAFQEQLQLFLFDKEFLMERITMPAGIARYVAEFIVQFYNRVLVGGALIALLYAALQLSTWQLARRACSSRLTAYILSFIPVWQLWFYMGDEQVKLTFAVALLFASVAMMCCPQKTKRVAMAAYIAVVTPLLTWCAGPTVLVFALYVTLRDNVRKPYSWISLLAIIYAIFCLLASGRMTAVPMERMFYGIHYSLVVNQMPWMQYTVMLLFAVVPVLLTFIPKAKALKNDVIAAAGIAIACVVASFVIFPHSYRAADYEVMKYDAMVRAQKWDDIIATAEKTSPHTPLTVATLNLALAVKGQLNERANQFYQNGWQGAFPQFNKDYEVSFMTAEIYFYLGLVNSAQRLDFEAMEALPDNAKSARGVKRLAETNIINGQYAVARKYLMLLQKTMFYRGWATRTMSLLDNPKAVAAHQLYGRLQELHLQKDFMFSDSEIDKIMGQLLMANKDNTLAMQYLLFLPQLEGNKQKYAMYSNFLRGLYDKK